MEVDSMHSTIERAKKYQKVYNVREWEIICRAARRHNPYHVEQLNNEDVYDFHKMSNVFNNRSINTSGERVNWLKVKWFRYQKDRPESLLYKERLTDEDFKEIPLTRRPGNAERGSRRQSSASTAISDVLEQAYNGPIPISKAKKDDLMSLVASGAVPECYRDFYESLPCRNNVRDALPEPDVEEEEENIYQDY